MGFEKKLFVTNAVTAVLTWFTTIVFCFVFALAILGANSAAWPIVALIAVGGMSITFGAITKNNWLTGFTLGSLFLLGILWFASAMTSDTATIPVEMAEFLYIGCIVLTIMHQVQGVANWAKLTRPLDVQNATRETAS